MDGLWWKTLLKWMIGGYHHFRKPPFFQPIVIYHACTVLAPARGWEKAKSLVYRHTKLAKCERDSFLAVYSRYIPIIYVITTPPHIGPTNGFYGISNIFPQFSVFSTKRQENQRLNRHVQEMRYELSTNAESSGEHRDNVARGEAEARPQRRVSKARNPEAWGSEMRDMEIVPEH